LLYISDDFKQKERFHCSFITCASFPNFNSAVKDLDSYLFGCQQEMSAAKMAEGKLRDNVKKLEVIIHYAAWLTLLCILDSQNNIGKR
jgi:hypothetical protein